jgi:DNA replication and repair protein RecF
VRDFRGYTDASVSLGDGLTVITGPNGAGKTNLLDALYFGCTGRSCRASNERELVRFGAAGTRVVVRATADDGPHELAVGLIPGQPKRMFVDGNAVERLLDVADRPLVSVFLPDRLELIKGAPATRRAHLDQFVTAVWPTRAATRRGYAQALAQRNALLGRIRAGGATRSSLAAWDLQLAHHGVRLMHDRAAAVEAIAKRFAAHSGELGLGADATVAYRPRSTAIDAEQLAAEFAARVDNDLERGFTAHGPHRDDLVVLRADRELRTYGSQGEQRLGLLALLLSERDAISATRNAPPLMLLDDVMSELDGIRRQALVDFLREATGQSVITTTDLDHVPGARDARVTRIAIASGQVLHDVVAA